MNVVEQWAPLPRFPHHQISSHGRIRRVRHWIETTYAHTRKGQVYGRPRRAYWCKERLIPTRFHKGSLVATIKQDGKAHMVTILSAALEVFGFEVEQALRDQIAVWRVSRNPNSSQSLRAGRAAERDAKHVALYGQASLDELKACARVGGAS